MKYFKRYFHSGFCRLLLGTMALAMSIPGWAPPLAAQVPVIKKIEVRTAERTGLSNRDMQNICTAAIATLFEQAPAIIHLDRVEQGTMHLSASPADDSPQRYACRLQEKDIVWTRLDGSWQSDDPDGQASFQLTRDEIVITVKIADGSGKERRFPR